MTCLPRSSARVTLLALALVAAAPARALAQPAGSTNAREHVENARRENDYAFCSKPKRPISLRQRELCPMAAQVEGCEALVAACKGPGEEPPRKEPRSSTWRAVLEALGFIARMLVWLLVALVIGAIAFPLIRAILRARRDKAIADAPKAPNVAVAAQAPPPPEPEAISDAEAALRAAEEHARRGEFRRALSLYLAASLAALDRRGAIRLARHRTNGEYVRACSEDSSRQPLREIVREVDKVEFGKNAPTGEAVAHVAARANAVVRAASLIAGGLLLLTLVGCGGNPFAKGNKSKGSEVDDPGGDELPVEVLRRSGYTVSYLGGSLAAMPMPDASPNSAVVVIDLARVPLEEESEAHLMRWVSEGGVLVLFGPPSTWPARLHVTPEHASDDHVDVVTSEVYARGARVGVGRALEWADSEPIAFIDRKSVYAAHIMHGKGAVVGVAGHELFTNIGVARPDNAAAFVALIDVAMGDRTTTLEKRGIADPPTSFEVHVPRAEDGIPPPSNPLSALLRAGLGKGVLHALGATAVLFLAFGIRHARPRPPPPTARRAFAEHVEATGAFYGRARALGHALASYGRFAEMRVRERAPRGSDPVAFLAAHANVSPEDAARVWKRATDANADDPVRGDELTTIRDLGSMLSSLEPDRRPIPMK